MRASPSLLLLLLACPAPPAGNRCNDDDDCDLADVCLQGFCQAAEGAGEDGAIAVFSVDGDGSAATPSEAVADTEPAAHRVRSALVVTGQNLDLVARATLDGQDLTIASQEDDVLTLSMPASLARGGLLTLSLIGASSSANAQVFLLQGERGADGQRTLIDKVAAAADVCFFGGSVVRAGADVDGDGALDDEEVDFSDARCAEVIHGSVNLSCSDEACVRDTLARLSAVRIADDGFVELALQDVVVTSQLPIVHADGKRITITGSATLRAPIAIGADLNMRLLDLTCENAPAAAIAATGPRFLLMNDISIAGDCQQGFIINGGAVLVVTRLFISGATQALVSFQGGVVFVDDAVITGVGTGVNASFGGFASLRNTEITATSFGVFTQSGFVDVFGDTITAPVGLRAVGGGVIQFDTADITGANNDATADIGAIIYAAGTATDVDDIAIANDALLFTAGVVNGANVSTDGLVSGLNVLNCTGQQGGNCFDR